jgi:signal transduction histidine kinase
MLKRKPDAYLLSSLAEMSGQGLTPRQILEALPAMASRLPRIDSARIWLLVDEPLQLEPFPADRPPLSLLSSQRDELAAITDPVSLRGSDLSAAYLHSTAPFGGWAEEYDGLVPLHGRSGFLGVMLMRMRRGRFNPTAAPVPDIRQTLALLLPAIELERLRDQVDRRYFRLFQLDRLLLLGEMAASIVHDLRSPLAIILLQLHRLEAETDARKRDAASAIRNKVEEVERFIRELLDFSRVHESQMKILGLRKLAEETIALIPRGRLTPGCVIRNDIPADVQACTDPHRLQRVLLNLIFNAMDAAGNDAQIVVSATAGDSRVRVSVSDNGPGIPDGLRPQLFKPFVTTKENGTGLGLYICRGLMNSLRGEMGLESGPGGTTVQLDLPAGDE